MLLNLYVKTKTFMICRKGQTLMEYGILAAVVAATLIGTILVFKNSLVQKFTDIIAEFNKTTT